MNLQNAHFLDKDKTFQVVLWVIFFCFSTCSALVFQKLLLPIIYPATASTALLPNDATYFHMIAQSMAEAIRLNGWQEWHLFPAVGASGNVAILAALYALFGPDPTYVIPINAVLHATSGLLLFLIVRELAKDKDKTIGTYAGLIAATLFVIGPSALNWYGQIHKDGYAILGIFLVLLGLLKSLGAVSAPRDQFKHLLMVTAGAFLVGLVRPYNLKILVLIIALAVIVLMLLLTFSGLKKVMLRPMLFFIPAALSIALILSGFSRLENAQVGQAYLKHIPKYALQDQLPDAELLKKLLAWEWRTSDYIPTAMEGYFEVLARTRAGMIAYGLHTNAGSMLDTDRAPNSSVGVIEYLPRALSVSLFAPFPDSWLEYRGVPRLVANVEILLFYISCSGLLFAVFYRPGSKILFALYFALVFMTIHGFTIPNLGTLHRLRYGYLSIIMAIGILGLVSCMRRYGLLDKINRIINTRTTSQHAHAVEILTAPPVIDNPRKAALRDGAWVMALALTCFLGFFARDVLMAHSFGFGSSLDEFFLALLIPMFLVTVLSIPLGHAFVPRYLEMQRQDSQAAIQAVISRLTFAYTLLLAVISLVIYVSLPMLMQRFYPSLQPGQYASLMHMTGFAMLLLLQSGFVVIGNAILNAHGRAVYSSAVQMIVPVMAVSTLLFSGFGVTVVMYGMVLGQFFNLLLIQKKLRPIGIRLWPQWRMLTHAQFSPLWTKYWPLVGSALFVSVGAFVATLLAMTLAEGSVSVLNLGTKVILFITGLLGAVISAVMLPYFSNLMSHNRLGEARRELSFFLIMATTLAVPVSLTVYWMADAITGLMLMNGNFSAETRQGIVKVMQYSMLQLPFFVCNALLLRFAIATGHVKVVFVVALLGMLATLLMSSLFMQRMGVAGIALGNSLGMLVSTVMLAISMLGYRHVTLVDTLVMLLSWLMFCTLLLSLHFNNIPSLWVILLAFTVLGAGYLLSYLTPARVGNDVEA